MPRATTPTVSNAKSAAIDRAPVAQPRATAYIVMLANTQSLLLRRLDAPCVTPGAIDRARGALGRTTVPGVLQAQTLCRVVPARAIAMVVPRVATGPLEIRVAAVAGAARAMSATLSGRKKPLHARLLEIQHAWTSRLLGRIDLSGKHDGVNWCCASAFATSFACAFAAPVPTRTSHPVLTRRTTL
jgi:hypothetical protein